MPVQPLVDPAPHLLFFIRRKIDAQGPVDILLQLRIILIDDSPYPKAATKSVITPPILSRGRM